MRSGLLSSDYVMVDEMVLETLFNIRVQICNSSWFIKISNFNFSRSKCIKYNTLDVLYCKEFKYISNNYPYRWFFTDSFKLDSSIVGAYFL